MSLSQANLAAAAAPPHNWHISFAHTMLGKNELAPRPKKVLFPQYVRSVAMGGKTQRDGRLTQKWRPLAGPGSFGSWFETTRVHGFGNPEPRMAELAKQMHWLSEIEAQELKPLSKDATLATLKEELLDLDKVNIELVEKVGRVYESVKQLASGDLKPYYARVDSVQDGFDQKRALLVNAILEKVESGQALKVKEALKELSRRREKIIKEAKKLHSQFWTASAASLVVTGLGIAAAMPAIKRSLRGKKTPRAPHAPEEFNIGGDDGIETHGPLDGGPQDDIHHGQPFGPQFNEIGSDAELSEEEDPFGRFEREEEEDPFGRFERAEQNRWSWGKLLRSRRTSVASVN